MKKVFLLLLTVSLSATIAFAHDPDLEEGDWGGFDDPYIIIDTSISYALYGYIGEGDIDVFEMNYLGDDELLRHEILVPVCGDHYVDFYPHYAILAPEEFANPELEIPIDMPEGYGVFYYHEPTIAEGNRSTWREEFTGKVYYRENNEDLNFPAEGTYFIVVFSPEGQVGDYTLATGYEEIFLSDRMETVADITQIVTDSWMKRDCNLAPDDPNAVINLDEHDMDMTEQVGMAMDMDNMPMQDIPDDLDTSLMRVSERFMTTISSDIDLIELNTLHSWVVTIQSIDGEAVEDAQISVSGEMPQHGHGMPTAPAMTEYLGDGQYKIDGMRFQMPGWWTVNVSIEVDGEVDEQQFNLLLQ